LFAARLHGLRYCVKQYNLDFGIRLSLVTCSYLRRILVYGRLPKRP